MQYRYFHAFWKKLGPTAVPEVCYPITSPFFPVKPRRCLPYFFWYYPCMQYLERAIIRTKRQKELFNASDISM
jgi:hypothetical protein